MRRLIKGKFRLFRKQTGFTLIETLIGLALLGIIAVAFLSGLSTTSKGVMVSQERVAAESLAKSQIESIKAQDYIPVAEYDPLTKRYELIDIPADLVASGYSIEIKPPETIISEVVELQSITITIKRDARGKLIISVYRVEE